jgi:AcrR family transcriptional regulator
MASRRPYTLGKREASVAATRGRIFDAALAEFSEHGIEHTSILAIARRADVAAGTIHYHFSSLDALAAALVQRLLDAVEVPRPDALPAGGPAERASAAIALLYAFYERGNALYPFFALNRSHPAVAGGAAEFGAALERLIDTVADDRASTLSHAALGALADVSFYLALTRRGLSREDAVSLAATLAAAAVAT